MPSTATPTAERTGAILARKGAAEALPCPKCGTPREPIRMRSGRLSPLPLLCPNCCAAPPEDLVAKRRREIETAAGQTKQRIPPQYHGARLDDAPGAAADLRAFYAGQGPAFCTLVGGTGAGKTRLGYALARCCHVDGRPWELHHTPTLLDDATAGRSMREVKRLGTIVALLILDDVLAEDPSPSQVRYLSELVDARDRWDRPTLITTNLDVATISEISDRIASRLSRGRVLTLSDPDYRLEARHA